MLHARADYNRFQDPEGKIPVDEPVMLFRAQDKYTARVVMFYAKLLEEDPAVDRKMVDAVKGHAVKMAEWSKHKTPDMP